MPDHQICAHQRLSAVDYMFQLFYAIRALSKNPVISADLFDSCHSFIRVIRDKISIMRSRMATNDANYTNLVATKPRVFSLNNSIVPAIRYRELHSLNFGLNKSWFAGHYQKFLILSCGNDG